MKMKTQGISPKVLTPAVVAFVVGFVLLLTGDTDTGTTVLLSAVGMAGIGAASSPGDVRAGDRQGT